jgi:hypothetical protein
LTLEGLAVSFYLRKSNNYDSLLQMARWFGYRDGYEDLIRVYTTQDISDSFEHLLNVESDLRQEILAYERDGMKPSEFAPAVKAHLRMRPSGRMGVAQRQRSFSGQIIQTFILDTKPQTIKSNSKLAASLVNKLMTTNHYDMAKGKVRFHDVEPSLIIDFFFNHYIFGYSSTRGIRRDEVIAYIEKMIVTGKMKKLDVLLSGNKSPKEGAKPEILGEGEIVINPVVRKNVRNKENDLIFFGAISDPSDFLRIDTNPILALYFIDGVNSVDPVHGFDSVQEVNPVAFAMGFPNFGDSEYWRQEIFKIS